jgi:hypothetical protein
VRTLRAEDRRICRSGLRSCANLETGEHVLDPVTLAVEIGVVGEFLGNIINIRQARSGPSTAPIANMRLNSLQLLQA